VIEFTPWAVEVLARAHHAATRLNPDARLRLSQRGGVMGSALTDRPMEGDAEARVGEITVFVAADVDGLVDVEVPHDRLVLRPAGSAPNPRG